MSASTIGLSTKIGRAAPAVPTAWWRPTFADLLVIALLAWAFWLQPGGAKELVSDANTGMHIRTGDWIRQTASVPHSDPYSFSRAGEPWFAWEWLTAVVYSSLNQAFGLAGVVLVSIFALGAAFALTLRTMLRSGAVPLVAVPLLLFGFRAASIHFLARPHLITWLFLALAVAIVEADRGKPGRVIWSLVPLSALWTNMHGGFLVLPVYLGLVAAGSALERNPFHTKRYLALAAAAGMATLVNPYGWSVHEHIWKTVNSKWVAQMVQEFRPPWMIGGEPVYFFYGLALLSAAAAVGMLLKRQFTGPIVIAFFVYASMRATRHVPLFLIAALPPVANYYSGLWRRAVATASRRSAWAALDQLSLDLAPRLASLSALGPLLLGLGLALPGHFGLPVDFSAKTFPVAFIREHAAEIGDAHLLTHDNWADYLLYHSPQTAAGLPQQKTWIDGRQDFFGPGFGEQYFALLDAEPQTEALLNLWRFRAILIKPSEKLAGWLKTRPDWREVAHDEKAVLFAKRD